MKFELLKQSLTKKLENAYYVFGEDEFLKSSAINQIKSKAITAYPEMNYLYFSSEDMNEELFFESLESMPFFSDKKVVVLQFFSQKKDKLLKKISEYLKNPNEFCVLIITSNSKLSVPVNNDSTIDCNGVSEDIIKKFILNEIRKNNASITNDAIKLLIEYSGSNMSFISNELNKCLTYTSEINSEIINLLVSKNIEYQIYELTNAMGLKNTDKTIEIYNNFVNNNKNQSLIYVLYNHFRKLYFISISTKNNNQLSEELKTKPYAIEQLRKQLVYYKSDTLKKILSFLSDTDYKIKSGQLDMSVGNYNAIMTVLMSDF